MKLLLVFVFTLQQISQQDNLDCINATNYTVLICTDQSISQCIKVNNLTRNHNINFIACTIRGVCGIVFNDFVIHDVLDAEGENRKEIALHSVTPSANQINNNINSTIALLKVTCIDEERFTDIGIGDTAELCIARSHYKSVFKVRVLDVINPKTLLIQANSTDDNGLILSAMTSDLSSIDSGVSITLTKCPRQLHLTHLPLAEILKSSTTRLMQANGCLSAKKDRAQSLTVLAALLAIDDSNDTPSSLEGKKSRRKGRSIAKVKRSKSIKSSKKTKNSSKTNAVIPPLVAFRSRVLAKLHDLGVDSPLKPVKLGGTIGNDTLDRLLPRIYNAQDGVCAGVCSVLGSLTAQECIKAVTGIHSPVDQLLVFESLDSLSDDTGRDRSMTGTDKGSIYENAVKVYGREVVEELQRMRVFIVGAGAIGCELLKTLALMGVDCPQTTTTDTSANLDQNDDEDSRWSSLEGGGVVITDMDTVERSNLNRQLLYRQQHIGHSKSTVSAQMIKHINPLLNILSLTDIVSVDTESIFDHDFWAYIDVVLPALDNVEARKYVDRLCVRHSKWLIDSGTLGTKGSTQVVIPHISESYSSSADPPEDAIPLCTLKSFPYQPDHCISWAKGLFERLFSEDIRALKTSLELPLSTSDGRNGKLTEYLESLPSESLLSIHALLNSLTSAQPSSSTQSPCLTADQAVEGAYKLFDSLYRREVTDLLKEHPLDELDEDGKPFWSG